MDVLSFSLQTLTLPLNKATGVSDSEPKKPIPAKDCNLLLSEYQIVYGKPLNINSGSVIVCPGTGQDGDIKAGVAWPSPEVYGRHRNRGRLCHRQSYRPEVDEECKFTRDL